MKKSDDKQSAETPIENSEDLGRFKSAESKARSLANLHPPFKAGEAPPPGSGRPRNADRQLLIKLLRRKVSVGGKFQTWEELIIQGQIKSAIKGNTQAAQFLFDRAYGRVVPTEPEQFSEIRVIVQRNTVRFPEMTLPELKGTLQ